LLVVQREIQDQTAFNQVNDETVRGDCTNQIEFLNLHLILRINDQIF
jgi:hypothetical protein